MHDSDQKALWRAAVLLMVVSLARWGISARPDPLAPAGGADPEAVVDGGFEDHLAATAAAVDEEGRRSRPLVEGETIDPNTADEVELDRLPGVGPATAKALVAARDSGAIFLRPADLLQVRGIGPASIQRIGPWLTFSGGVPSRAPGDPGRRSRGAPETAAPVDVNGADARTLQTLPGIGPAIAGRILEERRTRPFVSLDDLQRVKGIGPATIERLRARAFAGSVR